LTRIDWADRALRAEQVCATVGSGDHRDAGVGGDIGGGEHRSVARSGIARAA